LALIFENNNQPTNQTNQPTQTNPTTTLLRVEILTQAYGKISEDLG
jgi:hypothetical protein